MKCVPFIFNRGSNCSLWLHPCNRPLIYLFHITLGLWLKQLNKKFDVKYVFSRCVLQVCKFDEELSRLLVSVPSSQHKVSWLSKTKSKKKMPSYQNARRRESNPGRLHVRREVQRSTMRATELVALLHFLMDICVYHHIDSSTL